MRQALRSSPLFADLSDDDLDQLVGGAFEEQAPAGVIVFREGDEGDRACLILEGEVEILKASGQREVLLAVRTSGELIGEIALLDARPRTATVRAKTDTRFLSIPKAQMDHLLATSATAARSLFGVVLKRWRETEGRLRQSERMAQIGTLTAGLAHEMNNPAAAMIRASGQMRSAIERLTVATSAAGAAEMDEIAGLGDLLDQARAVPPPMSTLDRSDREAEVEDLLADLAVDNTWRLAAEVAATAVDLPALASALNADTGPVLVELLAAAGEVGSLAREIEEGANRLAAIVGALKSYSYLDQAAIQEVDIHRGLEDTLLIMRRKLDAIEVVREYSDGELRADAYGSELNQVWTNLIDNAADALTGTDSPRITIRTAGDADTITVEVEDNGPGIPSDIVDRVFDAFFTTKPPGSGTGLGLDISHGIVSDRHGGELTVDTQPGRTIFRVVLPKRQKA